MRLGIRNHRILAHCFSIVFCLFLMFPCVFVICSYVLWFCVSMLSRILSINSSTLKILWSAWVTLSRNRYSFKKRVQRNIIWKIMNNPWRGFFLQSGYFFALGENVFLCALHLVCYHCYRENIFHHNSVMNTVQTKGRLWIQGSIWTQMASPYNLQKGNPI